MAIQSMQYAGSLKNKNAFGFPKDAQVSQYDSYAVRCSSLGMPPAKYKGYQLPRDSIS